MASSDFSNVRVESNAYNNVTIRWLYVGANQVSIYRSDSGGSYALVVSDLDPTEVSYLDETVAGDTHYDYKLSDDGGSTFSSVDGVHSQLQAVDIANRNNEALVPPQFMQEEDVNAENLQFLSQAISTTVQNQTTSTNRCIVCPVDGALVLDCSNGCFSFQTTITEDINSITVIGCTICPDVMFLIPATITAGICGWPDTSNCFFSGDECFQAPLTGPRTAFTDGTTRDGLGLARGEGCFCEHSFPFNIQCCEDDDICTLACDGKQSIQLKACGGIGPYHWSSVGNVTLSAAIGDTVKVSVTNPGGGGDPGVAGTACADLEVSVGYVSLGACGGHPGEFVASINGVIGGSPKYGCDGLALGGSALDFTTKGSLTTTLTTPNISCTGRVSLPHTRTSSNFSNTIPSNAGDFAPIDLAPVDLRIQFTPTGGGAAFDQHISIALGSGQVLTHPIKVDVRTASMIALGCPACNDTCDLSGVIISVTDALGRTATISGT